MPFRLLEFPLAQMPAPGADVGPSLAVAVFMLLGIPTFLIISLWWQRKAMRGQESAIQNQGEAINDQKRGLTIAEESVEISRESIELMREAVELSRRAAERDEESLRLLRQIAGRR